MDQTLCLRHANFKVHWTLTEAERPHRATWEGRGPAGSYARTSYRLTPDGDGTHFEYENEFKAPGGLLGARPRAWSSVDSPSARPNVHCNNSKRFWKADRQRPCADFPAVGYRLMTRSFAALESQSDGRFPRREAQRDPGAAEGAQAGGRGVQPPAGRRRGARRARQRRAAGRPPRPPWPRRPRRRARRSSAAAPAPSAAAPRAAGRAPRRRCNSSPTGPGITIPEMAEAMGIQQNYLYRVMPDLAEKGQVTKSGRGWHLRDD